MLLPKNHPVYMAWGNLKSRCTNPNDSRYSYYGGRGITFCAEWNSFENFYKDMFPTWVKGLSLDRIDNNGNYCKANCKWSTKQEQANNRRNRPKLTHCKRGHELTENNILLDNRGHRICKYCRTNRIAAKEKHNDS